MFDPVQKTLLADQGEIRVGSKYQAEIPDKLAEGELRKFTKPFPHWVIIKWQNLDGGQAFPSAIR